LNDLWKYSPSSGEWTWVSGSSIGGAKGIYGTRGVAAATNVPGGRAGAVSWMDASGNLWLFGGQGFDSTTTANWLNDLWEYSPSSGEWTWVSGSSTGGAPAVYGTQGAAAATNVPGARAGAVSWMDASGNLWLFGGQVSASDWSGDLWEYSPQSGEWTWVSGSSAVNDSGVYGTQGVAAISNMPGARAAAVGWTDARGNLWLFGGIEDGSTGTGNDVNDLWKYSTQ
jgi:N-acetylneuraminic acid mutarotase